MSFRIFPEIEGKADDCERFVSACAHGLPLATRFGAGVSSRAMSRWQPGKRCTFKALAAVAMAARPHVIRRGHISRDAARDIYKVAVNEDGTMDAAATETLRAA